ncbi:thioester-forming surface-anchored protein [Trueperella pecoris]|uniref:Thioester-forming surface-anchored protein n=2 Tax=Trueperella pecoris TaxID=2733571 RepID=A0A7M1QZQ3_9ACTO|nr:thioester-forming surface-anchored protein [Trueperella pecoris]
MMILPPYGDGKVQKSHVAPLVSYPEGGEGAKETVYCFNMNRSIPNERDSLDGPFDVNNPRTGHELRYEKHYGEPLTAYADKARKNDDQDILDVLKNGFPNNASKLRESLGLTDLEFQYATQLAVWYYSDSDNGTYLHEATDGFEKINEAYKVLTKQKNSPVQLVSADPKVETLEIYKVVKPTGPGDNYQNLLGARFVSPLDGTPIEPRFDEPKPNPEKSQLKLRFSKLGDNDLSSELKGAKLALYQGEYPQDVPDKVQPVETWESGGVKDVSIEAGVYTYVEQEVPEGYDKASNIVFKIEGQKLYLKDGVGWKDSSLFVPEDPKQLTAYNDMNNDNVSWGNTPYGKFYYVDRVTNESSAEGDEVIYCFNINLKQPTDSYDYGENVDPDVATFQPAPKFTAQYSDSSLIGLAKKPRVTDPVRFADSIGRVIYAGYPKNGAGLKNGLSDTAFRAITQMAIYYFSDSFGLEEIEAAKDEQAAHGFKGILDPKNESIKSAYKKLIEYAEGDAKVPEDVKIPIYAPNNSAYQNFIGTLTNPKSVIPVVQMVDKKSAPKLDVTFSKVAAGQGNELAGATLTVTGGDDFSEEWVSTGEAKVLTLVAGEYTLTEKSAPEGYEIASAIEFRVTADKKLEIKDSASGKYVAADEAKVQMVDELKPAPKLDVTFSKVAAGQGNELAGATLTVTGGDDFSEEWVSTGEAKVLTLVAGEYTLTEKSAPEGYEIASAIEFRVTADKKLEIKDSASGKYVAADEAKVQMVDELKPAPKLDVTFSKVAAGQGNELAGATLTVTGGDDFSEEWVSTGEAKVLTLVAGEYTLTEKSAPEGYEIASAIEFRVTADKKLEIKDSASGKYVAADEAKVQMVDELKPAPKLDVTFSKVAAGQGNELAGATLTVTGGDDFSEEWVSTGEAKVLTLVAGEYTLTEKSAPEGYEIASAIEFRVTADKKLEIKDSASGKYVAADEAKVQMVDELKPAPKLDVTFSKVAAGQGNELAGATLTVTGGDDFSEEWVSTGEAKVLTLVAGEYTLTEKSAPEGYEIASAIEFRVTADKKLEIKDSASGKYVAADEAKVQMVDELKPAPAPTPSEVPTPNDESSVPATPAPTSETSNTPEKHDVLAWTGANIAGLSAVTAMLLAAGALLLRRKKA